ncbi:MAG: hypothetical protein KKA80_04905 [Candidatus Omnitrophica bacterium]|nr:hypothetical protein [Candidatus Omnitrophota bacterium]
MGILRISLIVILVFSVAGCAAIKGGDSSELEEEEGYAPTTLAVTAKLRFHDLPVPRGFKLIQNKSFVFQTEGTRVALLKYSGRSKLQDLVEFYKEQMLFYNWELLNVVEYGKSVLNFERAGQSCIITIEPRGMKKIIIISVAPKAKGSIETQAQK